MYLLGLSLLLSVGCVGSTSAAGKESSSSLPITDPIQELKQQLLRLEHRLEEQEANSRLREERLYQEIKKLKADTKRCKNDVRQQNEAVQRLLKEMANQKQAKTAVTVQLTEMTAEIQALKNTNSQQDIAIAAHETAKGSTYVRWGHTACPNSSETVYSSDMRFACDNTVSEAKNSNPGSCAKLKQTSGGPYREICLEGDMAQIQQLKYDARVREEGLKEEIQRLQVDLEQQRRELEHQNVAFDEEISRCVKAFRIRYHDRTNIATANISDFRNGSTKKCSRTIRPVPLNNSYCRQAEELRERPWLSDCSEQSDQTSPTDTVITQMSQRLTDMSAQIEALEHEDVALKVQDEALKAQDQALNEAMTSQAKNFCRSHG
ncbi:hypothetical protein BaRGS_00036618 [Batillaria attramentaria]|uniref:Uncharacterized protein n=1 Tax=Batillaria attramentaria TaxID=370345 RepID=A0ABD0JBH4_9CAEN